MTAGIVAGGIVLLLALLAGLIWAFGSRAKARLATKYPPPGRMVDVGGYRLHLNCQGTPVAGRPTVVMEAAHTEMGLSWAGVQPEVAKFTRVCTYDRASLGWSERSPKPRTADSSLECSKPLSRDLVRSQYHGRVKQAFLCSPWPPARTTGARAAQQCPAIA